MTELLSLPLEQDPQRRPSMLDTAPRRSRSAPVIAGAGTVVVHILLVALAAWVSAGVARKRAAPPLVTQMIEVEVPSAALPEPEPEPEAAAKPEPVVRKAPVPTPREPVPKPVPAAPPPAAAQAAQVITAADDVVDFGDRVVTGNAASYAGGVTEKAGTAAQAVRDTRARAGGVVGGTGTDPNGDRSRAPQLAGGAVWDCPFPIEADDLGMDHAVVALRVEVGADGRVASVAAVKDPGHGFGREARRCALAKRWAPGLDRAGQATRTAALINVRFDR